MQNDFKDDHVGRWILLTLVMLTALCFSLSQFTGCAVKKKSEQEPQALTFPTTTPPPISEPEPSGYIPLDWVEQIMVDHALSLNSASDRTQEFYFDACNMQNAGADMSLVEQGINKGINLLSKGAQLIKVQKVVSPKYPGAACVFAASQLDYRISNREWAQVIEPNLLLQFETQTVRGQQLKALTQKKKPYIFAEDMFTVLFESDAITNKGCLIYCDITDQASDILTFFSAQGVNVQQEFNESRAVTAGFNTSQIAFKKDRLVQVVETTDGWCMSTEDSSLAHQESFQNTPFVTEAANVNGKPVSAKIFVPQAQEHICTKRNKLQGIYRLNGANLLATAAAPNDVVGQPDFAQVDPTIRLGDCSNCHHGSPANPFTDQVHDFIKANTNFNQDEKLLADVFFDKVRMQSALDQINAMEKQSYAALGITADKDPLNGALIRVLRTSQSAEQVAGYASMEVPAFLDALKSAPLSSQALGNLLNGGTVSLGTLHDAFPNLVLELRLYQDPEL